MALAPDLRLAIASWPELNPERWLAQQSRYYETDRKRGYANSQQRRAMAHDAFIEYVDRETVWRLSNGTCGICGDRVGLKAATIDHIRPLSRHGSHSYANVQIAHEHCNRQKGDLLERELAEKIRQAPAPKRKKLPYYNSRSYRAASNDRARRAA